MRILCLADIHSHFGAFDPAALPDADACLIAGDISEYGHAKSHRNKRDFDDARAWLAALGEKFPVYAIPGNHDIGVTNADFDDLPNVHGLLNRTTDFEGLTLHGVSMTPTYLHPRMARLFAYMTADRAEEYAAYDFEPADIIISHSPPHGTLDRLRRKSADHYGPHIGSQALREYIARNEPKLVVCGHVHHDAGEDWIGGTRVVNAAGRAWGVEMEHRQ